MASFQVFALKYPEPNGRHVHPRMLPLQPPKDRIDRNRREYNRLTQDSQVGLNLPGNSQGNLEGRLTKYFHPFSGWWHPAHRREKKPTPGQAAPPAPPALHVSPGMDQIF